MTNPSPTDGTDVREELAAFGFSDTEIDTYLAVLSQDEPTTRAISEAADVTQRAVYDIAERLEDRGLVRVDDHGSPTTIRALPPETAVGNLTDRLESIQPTLEETYNESTVDTPDIRIIRSRETAIDRIRTAIEAARHEVVLTIPVGILPEIEAELRAARERDVFVLLLLGDVDAPEEIAEDCRGLADAVRYWDEHLPLLYTADDTEAMIGDSAVVTGPHGKEHVVYVSEENLAGSIFSVFIGSYWPASTELVVADPDPLPRSLEWFRDAIFQATVHRQTGVDLHAEIETAAGTHLSGTVVGINQQFLEPATTTFSLENSLTIDVGGTEVTVGGPGAFLEKYEAESITIHSGSGTGTAGPPSTTPDQSDNP